MEKGVRGGNRLLNGNNNKSWAAVFAALALIDVFEENTHRINSITWHEWISVNYLRDAFHIQGPALQLVCQFSSAVSK